MEGFGLLGRIALTSLTLHAAAFAEAATESASLAVDYGYRVVAHFPHDTSAFTQGLLVSGGALYESTGGYGSSSIRIVHLESGRVLRRQSLPENRFGEGLAIATNRLYQLTWKAGTAFVRDPDTLDTVAEFRYSGEGWGLAAMGDELVMSDGSAELRFLDAGNFTERRRIEVRDGESPVVGLNELEEIEGDLYANVWPTDRIAIINPADGRVRAWLDLSGILPLVMRGPRTDVLNGIAYDSDARRLFVTGKNWPRLFEIEVIPE
ncbi:MAG: glutaminyl-peptide cyclotransferase [Gammaproteobacteria bacterium]|nr:glutaminyl-peptide cyclotransferase [Gammaproteobacteria bacterium]MDE0366801.1 glutaminyl-peptide cyclotransferase [Gammaproteobacteria bacterium]